jgi:hypothetical protein
MTRHRLNNNGTSEQKIIQEIINYYKEIIDNFTFRGIISEYIYDTIKNIKSKKDLELFINNVDNYLTAYV